ncbi:MAG: class I SAM-dependent methyltransferase [Myxococcota bacterium]
MKRRRRGRRTLAQRADRYELYQKSVNAPDADVHLINRVFRNHYGRPPRRLREDFCGTAAVACHWVAIHSENRAWGIDLDPEPLAWGRRHNVARLREDQARRLELIEGDVLDVGVSRMDVTVAFNFSYFLFKTRPELLAYLKKARSTLADEGLLFLDAYGGADAQRTSEEPRKVDGFTYVWDQHAYDPIHNAVLNYIHFEFRDGSRMQRVFRYDWRLWSLAELRELLIEAGFSDVEVYWEGTDLDTGRGNDVFTRREHAPDDPAWVSYLVGLR